MRKRAMKVSIDGIPEERMKHLNRETVELSKAGRVPPMSKRTRKNGTQSHLAKRASLPVNARSTPASASYFLDRTNPVTHTQPDG